MRKVLKYSLIILTISFACFLTALAIKYSPTYVYRLLLLNTADVYDYTEFDNRIINKSDSSFSFKKNLDEAYVESLFIDEINNSGINSFDEYIKKSKTTALLFIKRDTILYEKYFNGFDRNSYFHSQSMAKTFISALIGFAIQDGFISDINDPITEYIPELKERDIRFEKITIRNLMMMRSGIKFYEGYFPKTSVHLPWHDEAIGNYHPNVRKLLLEDVQIDSEPNQKFHYHNYNTSYLGLVLERATQQTVSKYMEEKLWTQIGTEFDALFSLDSKENGFEYMPSRFIGRAIDYAKFGRLFLNEGNWGGKQVISGEWVKESTSKDSTMQREYYPDNWGKECGNAFYKYQWWGHSNCDSTFNYYASGNLGQTIYIIPHKEIIIVHCGNSNEYYSSEDLWHIERLISYKDFHQSVVKLGVEKALNLYQKEKESNPDYLPFSEKVINTMGYGYLNNGKTDDAILLFALNVETFPNSSNVYDSMGEAYMFNEEPELAIKYYQKSLELSPDNRNAREKIIELNKNSP